MDQEGVIKYELRFQETSPLSLELLRELNAWRKMLYLTKLIGQDPARYEGYGYGNISMRMPPFDASPSERCFVISATQTGALAELTGMHYALVRACHPERNVVIAEGPRKPSSESLTHGAVYALDDAVRWVMHVHSPDLWQNADTLNLPITRPDVPYGSPEMAEEVARLFRETNVRAQRLFAMGGHEDGLVAFGRTAEEAGTVLLTTLPKAFEL